MTLFYYCLVFCELKIMNQEDGSILKTGRDSSILLCEQGFLECNVLYFYFMKLKKKSERFGIESDAILFVY